MKRYNLVNNLTGWAAFLVAAVTYCLTVEPTASFWDCPEFITTAFKLEVGHPPGAPFFMLTGNVFSQFTSDPAKVALCINVMSALLSALCILFLSWTITHLSRKLIVADDAAPTAAQTLLIMGAGLTGALAYTWSDTFWFSAVEGEVYAYSSMFTALVFWLILKWENHADEPHSDRYLVLIFYLTGLSIGVHLLNLLCLPAITLVYYFRRNPKADAAGAIGALAISMVLVAAVLYGVVPGIVKVGGWSELLFVNALGMPFNTGLVVYILVLIGVVLAAIWSTTKTNRTLIATLYVASVVLLGIPFIAGKGTGAICFGLLLAAVLAALLFKRQRGGEYLLRKRLLNTSLLCMLMLMIGYSSYAVIVIRSTANTPMDQNSPEDIFSLGSYLSREQYGSTPLFSGPSFSSIPKYEYDAEGNGTYMMEKNTTYQRHEKKTADEPDRYDAVEEFGGYQYPSGMKMLFPRIHSAAHQAQYQSWLGDIPMHDVEATWTDSNGKEMFASGMMPSQSANLRFFLSYQVNFMYWRYFMWNFAGRQNDIQGHGEPDHGNWITGFSLIDNALYGDQSLLPDVLKDNKAHNVFFCLPLLLGLLGLFWQAYRGQRGIQQFWVVFFLFFMTGLAIVLYLNQTPSQPRERDYAYAGSFYAFAIWIGLGVLALFQGLKYAFRKSETIPAVLASVLGILVPLQMVSQTWDDHDRSGRYACRDFGFNYLYALPDENNPIIFSNGDNDTFPLWYAQEVEGERTDARVCNLSYLQTAWYTDQMRRPAYDSPGLPISWERYAYVDNKGVGFDYYEVKPEMMEELEKERRPGYDPFAIKNIIQKYVYGRVMNDQPGVIPTDSIVVPVNKANVIAQGMTLPGGPDSIPDYITISLRGQRRVTKSQMMIYEMLATNDWKRPMYMTLTLGQQNEAGLTRYLANEGLSQRITPFDQTKRDNLDAEKLYHNLMHRFRFGNVSKSGIYLDPTNMRMCLTHRNIFRTAGNALVQEGKYQKAWDLLQKCKTVLPESTIPYDEDGSEVFLAKLWYDAGRGLAAKQKSKAAAEKIRKQGNAEAAHIAMRIGTNALQYLRYASTLSDERLEGISAKLYRQFQIASFASEILRAAAPEMEKQFAVKLEAIMTTRAAAVLDNYLRQQEAAQQQSAGYSLLDAAQTADDAE